METTGTLENKIVTTDLNLHYGTNHALKDINLDIYTNKITAFIGPSGCGKSTYLKTLNRMNDLVDGVKIEGKVMIDGEDIYDPRVDTTLLRKKVGMVFQQPNPFPMSIYDNIAYGPRIHGIKNKNQLDDIVERSLKGAALWDEVSDRLKKAALGLSGGQQQRLCIARALAVEPEILLMDEPTSALVDGVKIEGKVMIDGEDIYDPRVDTTLLRKKVGMVFQQPNPFPMSIYDNIAYGPRIHGIKNKNQLDDIVERSLKGAALWDEVSDRLKKAALGLSGGQQQRLCIARALAVEPEILLMDEPTSALDPISTLKIEDLMDELKQKYTVVIVTHNMQQATRIADYTAFFLVGEIIEYAPTTDLFSHPKEKKTEDYITGRFG